MNDNMTPSAPEQAPLLPNIDVKVFPSQEAGKLLATANVTLGNCFTIKGLRVYDTEKGLFVSMPSVRCKDGNFHDVCHPTTKEMREALNAAVIGEYHQVSTPFENVIFRRNGMSFFAGQQTGVYSLSH